MTRIIGGSAGGQRISTPKGERTRPTSDRVREALFSAVESRLGSLEEVRFLDLYAGSGAIGLEARSRGAGIVTLVEHDRRTGRLIDRNAGTLGFRNRIDVVVDEVSRALACAPTAPYDVVYADPPYPLTEAELATALQTLLDHDWVGPDSLLVVERSSRSEEPTWPTHPRGALDVVPLKPKRYGETMLWYAQCYRHDGPDEHPDEAPAADS